jgi:hypothetical protein
MCLKVPGETLSVRPLNQTATISAIAPIPVEMKRRLQGGTSRSANAVAIQLKPQQNASTRTKSLAPIAGCCFDDVADGIAGRL